MLAPVYRNIDAQNTFAGLAFPGEVLVVFGMGALIIFQLLVHFVSRAALIKVSARMPKIKREKIFREPFLQNIQAEPPPVQFHQRMSHARRRHATQSGHRLSR